MVTYPLEMENEEEETLWEQYKDTVPRSKDLDEPIKDFLRKRVQESGNSAVNNTNDT